MLEAGTTVRLMATVLALVTLRAAADAGPQTMWVALGPTTTDLVFIEGRDAARLLSARRPPPVEAGSAAERQLLDYCSNGEVQRSGAEKGLVSYALGAIICLALDKAADRVPAELAKY